MRKLLVLMLIIIATACAQKTPPRATPSPSDKTGPQAVRIVRPLGAVAPWALGFDYPITAPSVITTTQGTTVETATCCDFIVKIEQCTTDATCPGAAVYTGTWTFPSVASPNTLLTHTPIDPVLKGLKTGLLTAPGGRYLFSVTARDTLSTKVGTGTPIITHRVEPATLVEMLSDVQPPPPPPPPPPPSACPAPAVNTFTGCYYNGKNHESYSFSQVDKVINFNWGSSGPIGIVNDPSQPADLWSVRWEGDFTFAAGEYEFTNTSDDGIRLFIDGIILIDKYVSRSTTTDKARRTLTAGTHRIRVDYFEDWGTASIVTTWAAMVLPPPPINCTVSEWSGWGTWTAWTVVSPTTEQRTRTRTRTVTQPAANGGTACPALTETETETRQITPPPPPPLPTLTSVMTTASCRFVLTAVSPFAGGGGSAQFRRGTTTFYNVGTIDTVSPYSRTVILVPGSYTFTVLWTKTGTPSITSAPISGVCK